MAVIGYGPQAVKAVVGTVLEWVWEATGSFTSDCIVTDEGRSSFVAGLLHTRLRIRLRPKSVGLHDAENHQRQCLMIMWLVKDPLSTCLA
ncbi:hypothetical protein TNCV_4798211 [Trichonephila clavipes]|nr:hypothetical protein TNCV_4798211 [Trichonephila clavipes]